MKTANFTMIKLAHHRASTSYKDPPPQVKENSDLNAGG